MKKLALIVSRIFEPIVVFSLLLIASVFQSGLVGNEVNALLLFIFVIMVLPLVLVRFWFVRFQKLDWDIKERKKRILPLFVLLVVVAIDVLLISRWENSFMNSLFLLFFVWGIGYFLITLFWKISGHTSVITLASLLIVAWYGARVWPIFLAIPLVAWARVTGKNHTFGQAIGGIVYSSLLHEVWKSVLG